MEVDMLILALICIILLMLILTVGAFLWYSGLFLGVEIKTCKPPFKTLQIAYKFAKGSYKDCGSLFTEAHSIAPDLRCIGVYYDDPLETDSGRVRYIIGLILNDEENEADEQLKAVIQSKGFQFTSFPEVEHVVYSSFPHNSVISVLIAVNRVIPTFRDYVKEKKLQAYPLIEICDGREIIYAAPLSKQEEFFVLEALAESEEEPTSDQKTIDESEECSAKELEELPETLSSIDSLNDGGSPVEELPSAEVISSLEDKNKGINNGSEASTESFEELQMDS